MSVLALSLIAIGSCANAGYDQVGDKRSHLAHQRFVVGYAHAIRRSKCVRDGPGIFLDQ